MAATTTPERVRSILDVTSTEYPDADIQGDITAAEEFVSEKLADAGFSDDRLSEIAAYVAADLIYPRVTGGSKGKMVSGASQGGRSIEYTNSSAVSAVGASPHWEHAVRLSNGRIARKRADFEVY